MKLTCMYIVSFKEKELRFNLKSLKIEKKNPEIVISYQLSVSKYGIDVVVVAFILFTDGYIFVIASLWLL